MPAVVIFLVLDLTQVEDAEIAKLVEHQKNVGLHAVTDGEFRRTFWHLDFLAALDGVKEVDAENSQCNLNTIMSARKH